MQEVSSRLTGIQTEDRLRVRLLAPPSHRLRCTASYSAVPADNLTFYITCCTYTASSSGFVPSSIGQSVTNCVA